MIELHADQVVRQILDDHVVITVRGAGSGRRQKVCALCQHPAPCPARLRVVDILAGRVDASGRPR